MIASQNGKAKTVLLLLQNNAHINIQHRDGRSSLLMASHYGHIETTSLYFAMEQMLICKKVLDCLH